MTTTVVSDLQPELEKIASHHASLLPAGDIDAWLETFTDDAVLWHSYNGVETPASAVAEGLRALRKDIVTDLRYDDVRRHQIDGGYVQQHTLRMTAKNGATVEKGVCLIVKVRNGLLQRVDEYLDSSVLTFSTPAI